MTAANRVRIPNGWRPRSYQLSTWKALTSGIRRVDVAAHRRWGKDDLSLHWTATQMVQFPGTYWHLLPEASQARKAIWDAVNPHTGKKRIDEAFPPAIRARTRDQEMAIELVNGATWQVLGSDNYDSLVGSPPRGVVFSEWSLARPEAWTYMRPILAENGGWAIFIWTPRGRNHATRAWEARAADPDTWFTLKSRASETDVFTPEQLAKEKAELIAETGSEEEGTARYNQEYEVDFDVAVPGAYYGSALGVAGATGRIGVVPVDPSLKVDTAWDLGIDDYTAIWFFQTVGAQVRVVDYYEVSGEGLPSIVQHGLNAPERSAYVYGTHYLPHDVMVRELGAGGRSRFETLKNLGLATINVGVAADPEDRINATRTLIPMCHFDAIRCASGLDRLRAYRKRWNKSTSSYTGPLHDAASHGSDAFGEFAVNRRGAPAKRKPQRAREGGGWMG